jgi:hypothetical protein
MSQDSATSRKEVVASVVDPMVRSTRTSSNSDSALACSQNDLPGQQALCEALRLAEEDEHDRAQKRREMNVIHSRRKRQRQKIEVDVLRQESARLSAANLDVYHKNKKLEQMLVDAKHIEARVLMQQQEQSLAGMHHRQSSGQQWNRVSESEVHDTSHFHLEPLSQPSTRLPVSICRVTETQLGSLTASIEEQHELEAKAMCSLRQAVMAATGEGGGAYSSPTRDQRVERDRSQQAVTRSTAHEELQSAAMASYVPNDLKLQLLEVLQRYQALKGTGDSYGHGGIVSSSGSADEASSSPSKRTKFCM